MKLTLKPSLCLSIHHQTVRPDGVMSILTSHPLNVLCDNIGMNKAGSAAAGCTLMSPEAISSNKTDGESVMRR